MTSIPIIVVAVKENEIITISNMNINGWQLLLETPIVLKPNQKLVIEHETMAVTVKFETKNE